MKKIFLNIMLLWGFLAFGTLPVLAQQTLNVGIIVVEDIDDDDPDLLNESAVIGNDVYYNGKILFAAGTPVIMDIHYEKRHGLGIPATVSARPVSTTDIYGQIWPLEGETRTLKGQDRHAAAVGCGVFFGIITFPVGLLFLCIKGQKVEISEGTQMVATVRLN